MEENYETGAQIVRTTHIVDGVPSVCSAFTEIHYMEEMLLMGWEITDLFVAIDERAREMIMEKETDEQQKSEENAQKMQRSIETNLVGPNPYFAEFSQCIQDCKGHLEKKSEAVTKDQKKSWLSRYEDLKILAREALRGFSKSAVFTQTMKKVTPAVQETVRWSLNEGGPYELEQIKTKTKNRLQDLDKNEMLKFAREGLSLIHI